MKVLGLISLFFSFTALSQSYYTARSNDIAKKYILEANQDLFRTVRGNKCQVTTNVESMKVSQHKADVAMVYYVRNSDLHMLTNQNLYSASNCPKTNKTELMSEVKEYSIVPSSESKYVNFALNHRGQLQGWAESGSPLFSISRIVDYSHNNCFKKAGMPFSSYVVFAIKTNGQIVKIKGNGSNTWNKTTTESYSSIKEFKKKNNLTKCN